jgi:hypothetical protein
VNCFIQVLKDLALRSIICDNDAHHWKQSAIAGSFNKKQIMKTILVATDFSDAAHNASLYAVELARDFIQITINIYNHERNCNIEGPDEISPSFIA